MRSRAREQKKKAEISPIQREQNRIACKNSRLRRQILEGKYEQLLKEQKQLLEELKDLRDVVECYKALYFKLFLAFVE